MKAMVLILIMYLADCMAGSAPVDAEIQDPDSLYRAKCTACHRLYQPQNYTYEKLSTYVTKYGKHLSGEECQELLGYLKENAKREHE